MFATQVNYWNLQETKRHNIVSEAIEGHKAESARISANAAVEANRIGWYNAETNRINAYVNVQNAATNLMNAETNKFNAETQRYTALVNADIGYQQLDLNRINTANQTKVANAQVANYLSQANLNNIDARTRNDYNNLQNEQLYWQGNVTHAQVYKTYVDTAVSATQGVKNISDTLFSPFRAISGLID